MRRRTVLRSAPPLLYTPHHFHWTGVCGAVCIHCLSQQVQHPRQDGGPCPVIRTNPSKMHACTQLQPIAARDISQMTQNSTIAGTSVGWCGNNFGEGRGEPPSPAVKRIFVERECGNVMCRERHSRANKRSNALDGGPYLCSPTWCAYEEGCFKYGL